jgi:hypothetical protein
MDIYQGRIGTISPAMGNYDMEVFVNIDRGLGVTGLEGVTGTGTLQPVKWDVGYTGIVGTNFTNTKHGFFI